MSWFNATWSGYVTLIFIAILIVVEIFRYKLYSLKKPFMNKELNKLHQSPNAQKDLKKRRVISLLLIILYLIVFIYILNKSIL